MSHMHMCTHTNTNARTCTTHAPHMHHTCTQEIDPSEKLEEKISLLCEMLTSLQHVVVHTGAGISTAAGAINWSGNESSYIRYKVLICICRHTGLSWTKGGVDSGETGTEGGD